MIIMNIVEAMLDGRKKMNGFPSCNIAASSHSEAIKGGRKTLGKQSNFAVKLYCQLIPATNNQIIL